MGAAGNQPVAFRWERHGFRQVLTIIGRQALGFLVKFNVADRQQTVVRDAEIEKTPSVSVRLNQDASKNR